LPSKEDFILPSKVKKFMGTNFSEGNDRREGCGRQPWTGLAVFTVVQQTISIEKVGKNIYTSVAWETGL
jgi:hypothetical protein